MTRRPLPLSFLTATPPNGMPISANLGVELFPLYAAMAELRLPRADYEAVNHDVSPVSHVEAGVVSYMSRPSGPSCAMGPSITSANGQISNRP